jgi:hypothetical protein
LILAELESITDYHAFALEPRFDSSFATLSDATRRGVLEQLGRADASISDLDEKTFEDVVSVQVYLTDTTDFPEMNAAYASHFEPPYPARTTIGCASLPLNARVEIGCMAETRAAKDSSTGVGRRQTSEPQSTKRRRARRFLDECAINL